MHSFDEVLQHFHGVTGLAVTLGISPQAISQWHGVIPDARAYQIQVMSNGRFQADRLPVRGRQLASTLDAPNA
jgi:hypothetical protein